MASQSFTCMLGGRSLSIETGKLAEQASGAITVRYGDTVVLVTAGVSREPREGVDFLPLTVDYEERLYAAGKIPGGFIRREGRPSEEATLACRLTDRPLRPLFPKTWHNEIQIIITVLSVDHQNDPSVMAVIGGSAALTISEVPFEGPVGAVGVGYINGQLVLNPTLADMENSTLDLVVASTRQAVVMVEAGAKEVPEELIMQAIQFGHEANQQIITLQEELQRAYGKRKLATPPVHTDIGLETAVSSVTDSKLAQALNQTDKSAREAALENIRKELIAALGEKYPAASLMSAYEARIKTQIRKDILENGRRVDGRHFTDIRPITCEAGILPRTHGSALFTRGQTQVLTIATLGSPGQEQQLDGLGIEVSKRFMHHYNFPPFSSGEVRRIGTPGRREIGHGALAEKALVPVIPSEKEFPYTIRLVSEVLSSSGSTSMASVCASSLSLMDAGIPVKKAVAGVAMGLITGEQGNYTILTDIAGLEDFNGDMDFKIAGTRDGVTAIQLDIKLKGVSIEILEKATRQAHEARMHILNVMDQTLSASRPQLSPYTPRMHTIKINPEKIGAVIGTGGKTIRSIISATKTTIDINDDGTVIIGSPDEESTRKAIEIIEGLTKEIEVGTIYTGKVTRILNFGAMVEVLPGKEGLIHVSELADYRVNKVEDVVKVGDEIMVKVIEVDHMGRINLSRKAVFDKTAEAGGSNANTPSRPPRRGPGADRPNRNRRF